MSKKENVFELATEPQSGMVEGEWEGQTKTVSNLTSAKGKKTGIHFKIGIRTGYTGAGFLSSLKHVPMTVLFMSINAA